MNAASLKPMVQHFWRGGYALGLSFWVFGVLGSLLLLAAAYAALDASGAPSTPVALAIGLGGLAYQVWVVVGVVVGVGWSSVGVELSEDGAEGSSPSTLSH